MNGEILIWNIEREQLLSKLIGTKYQDSYQDPMVINHNKNICVLHEYGVDLWQLESPVIQKEIWDLSQFGKIYYLDDGEHMILEFNKTRFYLIETDTFRIIREYRLPDNTKLHYQLFDGDMLVVLENSEYDPILGEAAEIKRRKEKRNKESIREMEFEDKMRDYDIPEKGIESQLRSVINRNRLMKKGPSTTNLNDFEKSDQNGKEDEESSETKNPRNKREQILKDQKNRLESEENQELKMPEVVKLELEDMEEDDDIAGKYNINTAQENTALSKYTSNLPSSIRNLSSSLKTTSTSKMGGKGKHKIQMMIDKELVTQEINPKLFKYRVVRILMERYSVNDPEEQGVYTLFQTNSEVSCLYSKMTEILKDENVKGATDHFKKFQSRVKANSPFSGNRVNVILVGLKNKNIFKVEYQTNKHSVPVKDKIVVERVFRSTIKEGIVDSSKVSMARISFSHRSNEVDFTPSLPTNHYETNPQTIVSNVESESLKQTSSRHLSKLLDYIHHVKSLKYYHQNHVMIAVYLSENKRSRKFSLRVLGQYKSKSFAELWINIDSIFKANVNEDFFIDSITVPSKKNKDPEYKFFVFSSVFIATFTFHVRSNSLEFNKFLKKESSSTLKVQFSPNRKLFYIPLNSQVMIYDESLTHFIYRVETTKNIDETILLEEQNLLLIYDRDFYYQLDLDQFTFKSTLPLYNQVTQNFQHLLDFNLFSTCTSWNVTFRTKNKHCLLSVPFVENLNLNSFPFEDLLKCFLKKNYKKYLMTYAEYYFNSIDHSERKDFIYGSLNPLLFAIYHNDSNLLEDLLDKYFYPGQIVNYVSPLEYSFAMNYRTAIKVLCDHLIRRDYPVNFTRADFKNLLKSNIPTCHRLIATIPSEPSIQILPKLVYMSSNVKAIFHDYLTSLLVHIKLKDAKYMDDEPKDLEYTLVRDEGSNIFSEMEVDVFQKKKTDVDLEIEKTTRRYVEDHVSDSLFKSEVMIKSVPFKYNYNYGTEDSATFIYNYSKSENEEFILSDWQEIVKKKWTGVKFPYMLLTFCYFMYMLFFVLSAVFYPQVTGLRSMALIMNVILIIYEIVQMITYFAYKPKM
jgi:hypothetical protein